MKRAGGLRGQAAACGERQAETLGIGIHLGIGKQDGSRRLADVKQQQFIAEKAR